MPKKKRAPLQQLLKAGEEARKRLVRRGIVTQENSVEKLMKQKPDLMLPGMPSYIPHQWTIKSSQRIMYDFLRMWQADAEKGKVENLSMFIEYAIGEMKKQEETAKKKMDLMGASLEHLEDVPVLGKVFEPINQYETVKGLTKFFVDSFAVCVVVRGETAKTSEFATWFLNWTDQLFNIWKKTDEQKRKTT